MLIFKTREEYQTLEYAAALLASGSKEAASVFQDYQKIRFPHLEIAKEKEQKSAGEFMENIFNKGVYEVESPGAPRKRIKAKKEKQSPFIKRKK